MSGRKPVGPGSPKALLLWARVRDSLWFIPAVGALAGVALSALMLAFPLPEHTEDAWFSPILFSGGAGSARSVLSTIAGSLITVTGVVFSITIVTLQLASTQFTPRVMRNFIADRANQSVLAIFIGTFTYTLLVLGALGSPVYGTEGVPVLAVTFSLVLLLVSVGGLIVYINRAARSAQVSTILAREAAQALRHSTELFPAAVGEPLADGTFTVPSGEPWRVRAERAGYVQAVDGQSLLELAGEADLVFELKAAVGTFVFPGMEILRAWPAERMNAAVERRIVDLLVVGSERTPEQDLEFSLGAIADIGVKALSTGINDPATAHLAIDRLSEVLAALSGADTAAVRGDRDRQPRIVATHTTTFERAVGLAFDQLRVHGADNPSVAKKIFDAILELLDVVNEREAQALRRMVERTRDAAREKCPRSELAAVEELAEEVLSHRRRAGYLQQRPSG